MSRPSDGMTLDELRDEFDWMFEFDSRMAERIREDADVHNLVDYVTGLETDNAALREELAKWERLAAGIDLPEYPVMQFGPKDLERENTKLRELAEKAWKAAEMLCRAWDGPCRADGVSIMQPCPMGERDELCVFGLIQRDLRELGVEVG